MKILVISNYYPPYELGGWEQLTRDVAKILEARGHQIEVLTSNHCADRVSEPEPHVHRLLHLESPNQARYHPVYTLTRVQKEQENNGYLDRVVQAFRPDIIFINGMWNLPHTLAGHAEALLPGRVAYYIASYWPSEPDAHNAFWQDLPNTPHKRYLKQVAGKVVNPLLPKEKRNALDFKLVMCVSRFLQEYLIEHADMPRENMHVVHNGIDPSLFEWTPRVFDRSPLKLIYAGRLSPDKGVHTAVNAMAHLLSQKPDIPVTLTVVGGGTEAYETMLDDLVAEHGIAHAVTFTGKVPYEEMPGILANHAVLLLPSIWPEPLARMAQEGMASGLVMLGTTTGGTPEILFDGETGLTFEADNHVMLADKINLLLQDKTLGPKLAKAARQLIEEKFTMTRMVDEIEHNFQQLVLQTNRV